MEIPKPISSWTSKDVGEWLSKVQLNQYRSKFEELCIDGSLLFAITDEDLQQDLGVNVRLHRIKILDQITRLQQTSDSTESASNDSADSSSMDQVEVEEVVPPATETEYDEDTNESIECPNEQVHHINVNATEESPDIRMNDSKCEIFVLKVLEGQLVNNIFIIGAVGAALGRHSASNDIVISESFVSRRHCDVKYNGTTNQFLLYDVGSTTGTFIMIRQSLILKVGTMFQMGLSEFKVTNIKFNPMGQAIWMDLDIFEGPARSNNVEVVHDGLTIGRDPENGYSIREDSQMSSFHSKIYLENGQFVLKDLGSTNRTWIRLSPESEKSQPWPVVVGDIIKIGSTVFLAQDPNLSQLSLPQASPAPMATENGKDPDQNCKICYARECNAAYYPCGHMSCDYCATKVSQCPVCRRPIQEIVKLYR